jgi:hypothetical protein
MQEMWKMTVLTEATEKSVMGGESGNNIRHSTDSLQKMSTLATSHMIREVI